MKKYLAWLFIATVALADTPPPQTISAKLQDGDGNKITSTVNGPKRGIDATIQGTVPVTQSGVWSIGRTWSLLNTTDSVNVGNFPANMSTTTLQTAGNASLTSIDGKLNSLGQKTMSGSVPVSIASDQSPIPVSGSFVASMTSEGATGSAVPANALQVGGSDGTNLRALATTSTGVLKIDGSAVTQPVSGTVTANQGGAPWSFNQTQINGVAVSTGNGTVGTGVQRVAIASNNTPFTVNAAQSGAWNVGGTVTANQGGSWTTGRTWQLTDSADSVSAKQSGAWSVGITGSLPLPTGAATSALQTTGNTTLSTISGALNTNLSTRASESTLSALSAKFNSLGQKTMAGSVPVTIASDQIVNVTGTISVTNTANGDPGDPIPAQATMVGGSNGTNLYPIKVSTTGVVSVDGSGVTQPVSGSVSVSNFPVTYPSTQSGAWTTGRTWNLSSGSDSVNVGNFPTVFDVTQATSPWAVAGTVSANQSGVWNINNISGTVSLPTGAATSALQTSGNSSLTSINNKLNSLGQKTKAGSVPVTLASDQGTLDVNIVSGGGTTLGSEGSVGSAVPSTALQIGGSDGTNLRAIKVSSAGVVSVDGSAVTQPISAVSLPLPTGAATSALQTTGNASLSAIDTSIDANLSTRASESTLSALNGKFNSLGQKTMANSAPVVISSDQSAIPISGTITATNSANGNTGSPVPVQATQVAGSDGTDLVALKTDVNGELQIDVLSSALPTGAATSALQTTGNSLLTSIDGNVDTTLSSRASEATLSALSAKFSSLGQKTMASSVPVSIASDQSPVPASQSGTWDINNISGTISLPAGAATSALQTTGNSSLSAIDAGIPAALGQTTSSASMPVVISSDQSAVPASQSGTWNINNISGTVSLPTGAATSALQTTGNSSLSSLDGKFSSLGQKTMANSAPVVLSSDQSAIPVSQSGTWNINNISGTVSLPTGAATSANQSTMITSLQLIDNLPHANDTALSNGVPVMGQLDDTATGTVTENNVSTVRITSSRGLHMNLRNAAGTELGTAGAPVRVDPTGTTTQPVNVSQINGVTPLMGNGVSGTGAQRVTIASDSTGQIIALGSVAAGATDSGNPVKVGGKYNSTLPTLTNGQRGDVQVDARSRVITVGGTEQTYAASVAGLAVAAAATDVFTLTGSASKTVRIKRVRVDGTATANRWAVINGIKRSTANTGGTSTNLTEVPYDSANAAATATALSYTANPTLGTAVGTIRSVNIDLPVTTPANAQGNGPGNEALWEFGGDGKQEVVLRGTSEVFAVNFNGATIGGATLNISIEWTEE